MVAASIMMKITVQRKENYNNFHGECRSSYKFNTVFKKNRQFTGSGVLPHNRRLIGIRSSAKSFDITKTAIAKLGQVRLEDSKLIYQQVLARIPGVEYEVHPECPLELQLFLSKNKEYGKVIAGIRQQSLDSARREEDKTNLMTRNRTLKDVNVFRYLVSLLTNYKIKGSVKMPVTLTDLL